MTHQIETLVIHITTKCETTSSQRMSLLSFEQARSGAVVMQSNITEYWVQQSNERHRIWIRFLTHKRDPIARPWGRDMGVFCEKFGKILLHYKSTTLYKIVVPACIYMHMFGSYQHWVCRFSDDIRPSRHHPLLEQMVTKAHRVWYHTM